MTVTHINRNWLIAGLVILVVFMILILYRVISLLPQKPDRPQLGHRSPVAALTYCGADLSQLCIVSFSQEVDGSMQIDFHIPDFFYPDFILKIDNNGQENRYECQRGEDRFVSVVCTGAPQVPGQTLQFKVISKDSQALLAEGTFAIIGIALLTPEAEITATLAGPTEMLTETPIETPTAILLKTPTPIRTPTIPSYPNPTSYPNPVYP